MRALCLTLLALALSMIIALPAVATNGMQSIGTTVRQESEGGAFIAVQPSAEAIAGNPAELAFLDQPELYFDFRLFTPVLDYTGLMNATGRKNYWVIPNLAYAAPLGERWGWGLGVVSAAAMGYKMENFDLSLLGAPAGTTGAAGSQFRYLTVTPALAYKLDERTSIGAAFNWSTGATDEQSYDFFSATTGHGLSNLSGKGYSTRLGIYHECSDDTAIGAFWRSRTHLDVTGGTLTFGPMSQTPGLQLNNVEVKGGEFPEMYGAGIRQRMDGHWTGTVEYRKLLWDKVKDNISVVPQQGDPIVFPMNWKDQDVYVVGLEYRPDCTDAQVWRFGANYGKSPVPDSTLSPLFPTITELHLTAGYEQQVSERLSLLAGLVYGAPHEQTTPEGSPLNMAFGAGQPYSVSSGSWEFGVGLHWKLGGKAHGSDGEADGQEETCLTEEDTQGYSIVIDK